VLVTFDGPFGGCSLDLGEYENVFLAAGGVGVTFILGLLDDLVGRIVRRQRGRGERTRRIEFAWAIRSYGEWFLLHFIKSG
jgi:predicted ferric reductase